MKFDVQKIIEYVSNKSGEVLDLHNYKNNSTKLLIQCKFGHQWNVSWSNLKNNKWCPYCSKNKKLDLKFAQNIAATRGGRLLSTVYINSSTKLSWECKYEHKFQMHLNAINSRNNWCPYCSIWTSEEICRIYFSEIFNQPFIKIRPDWLINSKGNRMELDGYGENPIDGYHLAFEHQGEQHFKKTNFFKISFEQRYRDDQDKIKLCTKNNTILVQIPQLFKMLKLNDLKFLIKKSCENFININKFDFKKDININNLFIDNAHFEQICKLIKDKGGICKNKNYINSVTKFEIECEFGHLFLTSAKYIKNGSWCPICSKNKKLTIEEMQQLAKDKNGACLSSKYIDTKTKLSWQCFTCNNIWKAAPRSIKNNRSWCPKCGLNKNRNNN